MPPTDLGISDLLPYKSNGGRRSQRICGFGRASEPRRIRIGMRTSRRFASGGGFSGDGGGWRFPSLRQRNTPDLPPQLRSPTIPTSGTRHLQKLSEADVTGNLQPSMAFPNRGAADVNWLQPSAIAGTGLMPVPLLAAGPGSACGDEVDPLEAYRQSKPSRASSLRSWARYQS